MHDANPSTRGLSKVIQGTIQQAYNTVQYSRFADTSKQITTQYQMDSQQQGSTLLKCTDCNGHDNLKVLVCAHIYCNHCLEQLLTEREQTVCCRLCHCSTDVSLNGIAGLPSHKLLGQIKDIQGCTQWLRDRYRAFLWQYCIPIDEQATTAFGL